MSTKGEKDLLPQSQPPTAPDTPPQPTPSRSKRLLRAFGSILSLYLLLRVFLLPIFLPDLPLPFKHGHQSHHDTPSSSCVQADPVVPQVFDTAELITGNEVRLREWLAGSVRVPTEVFDEMGEIGVDERWDVFWKFSEYLEKAFPLVHQHLTRTRVVTHALVFEWIGSDPSLKPLLLTGHQGDVVPVLAATRKLWTHDPFGGEYDPETDFIWGRGSVDDKSGTIGVLSAVELLLESGKFQPARTVILAFGNDEETGGKVGAYHLNEWLVDKYGNDSMALLVDEGSGIQSQFGQLFAMPAVGEKGYMDVEIRVETKGGHSSVPPQHTGIGLISLLIAALERKPHEPSLNPDSPLVTMISCAADFAPDTPKDLKKAIRKVEKSLQLNKKSDNHEDKTARTPARQAMKVDKKALKEVEEWWVSGSVKDGSLPPGLGKAMVSTTQAVDVINGGVKVNALPEVVTAIVNHRISLASTVGELQEHLQEVLGPVAAKYNLDLEAFGEEVDLEGYEVEGCMGHHHSKKPKDKGPKAGKVVLSAAYNSPLEPAPVSPHHVDDAAWRVFAGTIKGTYATRPGSNSTDVEGMKEIQVAPMISTGNTDTKRYWGLTRNIYRFEYMEFSGKDMHGIHTVDEHITAKDYYEEVRFFANLIVNVDESREI